MNNEKKQKTIAERQEKEKARLIESFKKMPVIEVACAKAGVSRATYYRWINSDDKFAKEAERVITEGEEFICDMAESQHITLIKDKYWPAIRHWLEHRSPKYAKKVNIQGQVEITYPFDQPQ